MTSRSQRNADSTKLYYLGRNEVSNQDFLGIVTDYDEETKMVTITERNYFETR